MQQHRLIFLFLLLVSILAGCSPEDQTGYYPGFDVPQGFPQPVYNPLNSGMTEKGYALGKKLFYDPILSQGNVVSCEDCHKQWSAFADGTHPLSHGVDNQFGARNAPPVFNLAWSPYFMWDGGINHIEVMPVAPITNEVEMGETIAGVVQKLNADDEYPALFAEVFGTTEITSQQMLKSLAWFLTSIVSADAKYDRYMAGQESFNAEELAGLELFGQLCADCHTPPLFTNYSFRNNGLDAVYDSDSGRAHVTGMHSDVGKFKVPTLRNAEYSGYYMHDGRFNTLEEVMNHYQGGIVSSATLDTALIPSTGFALSETDKQNLIAFIKTLSDINFIQNEAYHKEN